MDTAKIECTAEDLIAHYLQKNGLLVAKPKFDRGGADLLVFAELADGVKFCRVQCKGRTVTSNAAKIEIPVSYLSPSLVVFLFVDSGNIEEINLYCFFSTDIEQWKISNKNYTLPIPKNTFKRKLEAYKFDSSKADLIRIVIRKAETKNEFKRLVYGVGVLEMPVIEVSGLGKVISS